MPFLEEEILIAYFVKNENILYLKKNTFCLHLSREGSVTLTHFLFNEKGAWYEIELIVQYPSAGAFIEAHGISSLKNLNDISAGILMSAYLSGNGMVHANLWNYETEINFKIEKRRTIVFSLPMNFYDEIEKVLSLTDQFRAYLDEREGLLNQIVQEKLNRVPIRPEVLEEIRKLQSAEKLM
ncbi:MAG: hypothetical protein V4539_06655 [Bacteroidota bacterium]